MSSHVLAFPASYMAGPFVSLESQDHASAIEMGYHHTRSIATTAGLRIAIPSLLQHDISRKHSTSTDGHEQKSARQ
jgi:hypothetical protein